MNYKHVMETTATLTSSDLGLETCVVLREVVEVADVQDIPGGVLRVWQGGATELPQQRRHDSSSITNFHKGLVAGAAGGDGEEGIVTLRTRDQNGKLLT